MLDSNTMMFVILVMSLSALICVALVHFIAMGRAVIEHVREFDRLRALEQRLTQNQEVTDVDPSTDSDR